MFNHDNKKQEQAIAKQIAEKQQLYQRVFDTIDGKAVLKDLEDRCFIKRSIYDPDDFKRGMNEGRRSIHFYITNLLESNPQELLEGLMK